VRRLFSSGHVNPTLGTLAEIAAALGLRVVLEPLSTDDRRQITQPLLSGSTADPRALADRMDALRERSDVAVTSSGPGMSGAE
jgi:hypothetical protein